MSLLPLAGVVLTIGLSFVVVRAGLSGRTVFVIAFLVATVVALALGNLERLLLGIVLLDIPLRWDRTSPTT